VKVKGLMSCRRRLDHFKDVAFLLGWSEKLPKHLSCCDNPRLKLESALIAFEYYTVGRLLIFPPCYSLQMDSSAWVSERDKKK
jgi:hypothetical protein